MAKTLSTPAATTRVATRVSSTAQTAAVKPEPTIRTMVVCVPDALPTEVLISTRQLDQHLGVAATSNPRFWATPTLRPWQRRHLFDLRPAGHGPRYCAGGPVGLLDLAGMRHGAALGARVRHQHWTAVVRGTGTATPWPVYAQRHLDDPAKHPLDKAKAEFESQPRVLAMRLHNAAAPDARALNPDELEVLQAGPAAHSHYYSMWAVCTDAVLTGEGTRLQPASDHLADRVSYLSQAIRYLGSLGGRQRLLAVAL